MCLLWEGHKPFKMETVAVAEKDVSVDMFHLDPTLKYSKGSRLIPAGPQNTKSELRPTKQRWILRTIINLTHSELFLAPDHFSTRL